MSKFVNVKFEFKIPYENWGDNFYDQGIEDIYDILENYFEIPMSDIKMSEVDKNGKEVRS